MRVGEVEVRKDIRVLTIPKFQLSIPVSLKLYDILAKIYLFLFYFIYSSLKDLIFWHKCSFFLPEKTEKTKIQEWKTLPWVIWQSFNFIVLFYLIISMLFYYFMVL